MGFDIKRFVNQDIDKEFICDICQDVLEEPLMIVSCQHLFCSQCIRDCIRLRGVCPKDRSLIAINQLVEPIRAIKNLINKLRIRCESSCGGCEQVLSLGELQTHYEKCNKNPENNKTKCFCNSEFFGNDLITHKEVCLEFQKNELEIARTQMSTYSTNMYDFANELSAKVSSDSEINFLFKRFKQSLSKSSEDYNDIQNCLLYINWKLLVYESQKEKEKDLLSTIRYIKYGFEDLSLAVDYNYDNLCDFVSLKAFNYLFLCETVFKNKHINRFIASIIKNFKYFDDLLVELMNKKCVKLLTNFTNSETNDMNTCIDCATILSEMTLMGDHKWKQIIPDFNRKKMLIPFKSNVLKWKFSPKPNLSYESFAEIFAKLKSNEITTEVNIFYISILAFLTKTEVEKYVPMIEAEKGLEFLQKLFETTNTGIDLKRILEILINQCNDWKNSHKN